MIGRITFEPPHPTACDRGTCEGKPPADNYRPGTIWTCDECDREWVVVEGAQYNEPYQAWRHLTERNREGRDIWTTTRI